MENNLIHQANITSRYGKLEFATVYIYKYSYKLLNQKKIKLNLINWLHANKSLKLFRFTANGFETLHPMPNENWQYIFMGTQQVKAPFRNTPLFSQYLHQIYDSQLITVYPKSGDDFTYNHVINLDFKLDLCFNYNTELFEDGRFFIHFFAKSHIKSAHNRIQNIINFIKSTHHSDKTYFPVFHVHDNATLRSKAILPLSKKSLDELEHFKNKFPEHSYSFDYEFMSRYFPGTLSSFMVKSKVNLINIVKILSQASSTLIPVDGIRLYELPSFPIKLQSVKPAMNLLIGNKKKVSKLSAVYYEGMFLPVSKSVVQPMTQCKDKSVLSKIYQLVDQHFNINGKMTWLPGIEIDVNGNDINKLVKLQKEFPSLFVMIFTDVILTESYIQGLQDRNLKYQIIQLPADVHRLSNFAVKCLYKMGAKVALLHDLGLPKDSYIIGLDMGHWHGNKDNPGFSTLVMVFFNILGEQLFVSKIEDLPLNEALQTEYLILALEKFKKHLDKSKRNQPAQLVFHRDGKLHSKDHSIIKNSVQNVFNIEKVEIVEIIKSGHPYIYTYHESKTVNASSGQYWHVKDKDYALLITNDQVNAQGEALRPIVIKRKYGDMPFEKIVSQVYWFCKLYTNNIYYPSRLPATTEVANNRAGTGVKEYKASYKGKR